MKATLKDGEVTLTMSEAEAHKLWDVILNELTSDLLPFDHALGSVLMGEPEPEYVVPVCSICGGHDCG